MMLDDFDHVAGTDTDGTLLPPDLGITFPNVVHSRRYQPTFVASFRRILTSLEGLDFPRFTFLDCGSGKGRALLLASHYPFRRVIGIEFSNHLHTIAQRNIALYQTCLQRCSDVQSVYADIAEYPLPHEPILIYLFNPFGAPVLSVLLDRIEASYRMHPRSMILSYLSPEHYGMIAERTMFVPRCVELYGTSQDNQSYAIFSTTDTLNEGVLFTKHSN